MGEQESTPAPRANKKPKGLSTLSVRADFSLEEINKLISGLSTVVSSIKADQQGIDPKDMIKTIRGGKVVWITKDEMNAILAKRRKISGAKFAQRSVRGENSLSSEINRRIEACKALIEALRKAAPKESADFTKQIRNLEAVQNLSASHAREVRLLETAIQRKKKEDPLLREMEEATTSLTEALERKELSEVDVCQSYCDRHMEEYLAKQKRLEPYVKKAKECRMAFLQSKQQYFQIEFDIIEMGNEAIAKHLDEILYHDKEGKTSQSLVDLVEEIRSLTAGGRPSFQILSEYPPEELENQKERFAEADKKYLVPLFDKAVMLVSVFKDAWLQFVEGKPAKAARRDMDFQEAPKEEKEKRMVFQEGKDKS